jgi:muramoyltetrapeptide carboxypeptidase
MELQRPRCLVPGDRVAVVAPSSPIDPDRLERGLATLKSLDLDVVLGESVHERLGYLAGPDALRAADFQGAWCDPNVKAIACARGGYGAMRILDLLDWDAMAQAGPKILLGSSDITALHEAVATHLGLTSLHGPMPIGSVLSLAEPEPVTIQHLRNTLFEPEQVQDLHKGHTLRTLVGGRASGRLVGGNVALLAATLGTDMSRPAAGSIAILEDVDETPYRLDRLLTSLIRAGWFDDVQGIVLGDFTNCAGVDPDVWEVLAERLAPLDVPMVAGLPFGHGPVQLTIPLGIAADLDADAGKLTLREPALV